MVRVEITGRKSPGEITGGKLLGSSPGGNHLDPALPLFSSSYSYQCSQGA